MKILQGDCMARLKELDENSVDAIVTDPPYELGFMGKAWDNTGIANDVKMWRECLRVLKPGGHLLSFGGSRTYHRMACAIEDAGFEIRDQIMWVYASGMPKSLDVSKAIDKAGGRAENWFGPWLRVERERIGMTSTQLAEMGGFYKNVNHGGSVVNWELGYGLPSASEFNKVCELLHAPFARIEELEREIIGQRKVNRGLAFTSEGPDHLDVTLPATDAAKQWDGWGTALKPAHEPICVARKPIEGTVAANVLRWGTGAINIDGCRVEYDSEADRASATPQGKCTAKSGALAGGTQHDGERDEFERPEQKGRWPANLIHDGSDEVLDAFPNAPGQQGDLKETGRDRPSSGRFGDMGPPRAHKARRDGEPSADRRYTEEGSTNFAALPGQRRFDAGSAARFFYCAKTSKSERGEGNIHPTVKPIALMRYLCRLVTPPGGVILDPFTGSGSTGLAAMREGFDFIGIELNADYIKIANARILKEVLS
jgi:DNA modification methylase